MHRGEVEIVIGTTGEFDLTASLLLLDGDDWIDSIFDVEGEDAIRECVLWAERNGYLITNKP